MVDDKALVVSNSKIRDSDFANNQAGLRNKNANVPARIVDNGRVIPDKTSGIINNSDATIKNVPAKEVLESFPGTKARKLSAIQRGEAANSGYVPHLTRGDIQLMATVAAQDPRHGRRDATLIRTVYDAALRISEALDIRYVDLVQTPDGWTVSILDSSKTRANTAAISAGTVMELQALCYELHRAPTDKIFGISRSQAYRIIVNAYEKSGVRRPGKATDGVGAVHILRHTGALERLKASGNPRSVQAQLRHRSASMTMRYLRTQQQDESIAIQQGVNPW